MSIILLILKIIGIILLALLGVILTAVILVLLVPVRYRVWGKAEENVSIHVRVTWLLHLISFGLDYQDEEVVSGLKVLGMTPKKKVRALDVEPDDEFDNEESSEKFVASIDEKTSGDDRKAEMLSQMADVSIREEPKKKPNFFAQVREKIQGLFEKINKLKTTIQQLVSQISHWKEFIADEANQFVFLQVLAELKYVLGHFGFRKMETDLRFSAGDPATTGQALGVLSMFPILYQYQVSVVPDFESEEFYVKGTFDIRGRARVIHVVRSLIHLIRQKEVRIFVKKVLDR